MNSAFVVRGESACLVRREYSGAFTIMAGQRGSQGRPGTDIGGGVQTLIRQGAETISAHRVVYESRGRAYLAQPDAPTVLQVIGLSISAGAPGAELVVQTAGFIDDASWSWLEGLVFCGPNGVLTQTPPTSGYELVVGFASSATRLNLDFDEPVFLA
ncbi:hypothetical protein [Pseudomonas syringae]|uniref:hypothetical protein n=1 Tax=Pseudomonas syringae TaxID=317 RepID=UPI0004662D88|nr:hypothetical protein [Pseudomonas syringae]